MNINDIANPFKFVEVCMFRYLENLAKIEGLRSSLKIADKQSSLKTQNYEVNSAPAGYIDNIPSRVLTIDAIETLIAALEWRTSPITRLLNDLDDPRSSPKRLEMLGILRTRYLLDNTQEKTREYLKMSKRCYLVRRKRLVETVINYMGLDMLKKADQKPYQKRTKNGTRFPVFNDL